MAKYGLFFSGEETTSEPSIRGRECIKRGHGVGGPHYVWKTLGLDLTTPSLRFLIGINGSGAMTEIYCRLEINNS